MTADRWTRLRGLFHDAQELDAAGRQALLAKLRSEDLELYTELQDLLDEQPGEGFLEQADWPVADDDAVPEMHLGPYCLTREIGRGGMGVVFEAVREEEGIRRTVAIKVLTASALDRESRRRFRLERKALSDLCHPNIAQLLDWGETPDRHAYLVMEHVPDAEPIDEFCRRGSGGVAHMVQLLLQVCDAIADAHQHLVVHRDLKPANILVTPDGRVKLLDFGIAKLLDAPEAATRTLLPRLTPAYAAPEQITGGVVSTASDVYSLGVLAYELLTGSLPYGQDKRTDQMLWAVVNEIPKAPAETPGIDKQRRRILQGDLGRIVMKALEKEPARRYLSAEALAGDLRSYLMGRPVKARPDTWRYRTAKFLHRHRVVAATVMLAIVGVGAGAGAAVWKAHAADRERTRAEERLRDLQKLSHSLIFELHDLIENLPGSTKARNELVTTALRYLDRMSSVGSDDDSLQLDIASGYARIGQVQASAFAPSMGDYDGAARSYEKARAILASYWRKHPFDPQAGRLLTVTSCEARLIHDPNTALHRTDEDLARVESWVSARPADAEALWAATEIHQARSQLRRISGDLAGALEEDERMKMRSRELIRQHPNDWRGYFALGSTGARWTLRNMGELKQALTACDEDEGNLLKVTAITPTNVYVPRDLAVTQRNRAQALLLQGKPREALVAIAAGVAMMESLANADSSNYGAQRDLAYGDVIHGKTLIAVGRLREGTAKLREAVGMFERLPAADFLFPVMQAEGLNELGLALLRSGQGPGRDQGASYCARSLELLQREMKIAPSNIELLRQRARAYRGLAEAAELRHERATAIRMFHNAAEDWRSVRQRSGLFREGLEELALVEQKLRSESVNSRAIDR